MTTHQCPKCGQPLKQFGKKVSYRVGALYRCETCQYNEPQWYEASPFQDDRPRDGMGMGHIKPLLED